MNTPEIKVIGLPASGKSALAFAIKAALESHGIQVFITGVEDEIPGAMEETWVDRIAGLKGQVVVVETVRQGRGAAEGTGIGG